MKVIRQNLFRFIYNIINIRWPPGFSIPSAASALTRFAAAAVA